MNEIYLRPCPLCGGRAEIQCVEQSFAHLKATIRCVECGLTLDWDTPTAYARKQERPCFIKLGPDPFELWNTRTEDIKK